MRTLVLLISSILLIACPSNLPPCFPDSEDKSALEKVEIHNQSAKWNCGLEKWEPSGNELIQFCSMLEELKERKRVSLRRTHMLVDIFINQKPNLWVSHLVLVETEDNEFVFKLDSKLFQQDTLAQYILDNLRITNVDSTLCH